MSVTWSCSKHVLISWFSSNLYDVVYECALQARSAVRQEDATQVS